MFSIKICFYFNRNQYQPKITIFISIIPRRLAVEVSVYFVKSAAVVVFIRQSQEYARLEVLFMRTSCPPMEPV